MSSSDNGFHQNQFRFDRPLEKLDLRWALPGSAAEVASFQEVHNQVVAYRNQEGLVRFASNVQSLDILRGEVPVLEFQAFRPSLLATSLILLTDADAIYLPRSCVVWPLTRIPETVTRFLSACFQVLQEFYQSPSSSLMPALSTYRSCASFAFDESGTLAVPLEFFLLLACFQFAQCIPGVWRLEIVIAGSFYFFEPKPHLTLARWISHKL